MKKTKVTRFYAFLFVFCIGAGTVLFLLNSCDSSSDDDGGAGADFDAAQYYTKTEVNDLLGGVFTGQAGDTYQTIAAVDFAGRATTGWTVPAGCKAGLFEVNVSTSGAPSGPVNIIVSSATTADVPDIQFTPASSGYSTALFVAPVLTAGSTVYAWHTTNHSGAADFTNITGIGVRCRAWIK